LGKSVVSAKIEDELRAKLNELAKIKGKSVNQLLGEIVSDYLDAQDETFKEFRENIEKTDEKVKSAVCPLCGSHLEYVRGWFSDEIRCSNPHCDTRDEWSEYKLPDLMGKFEYQRLLNIRRREHFARAMKEEDKKSFWWWGKALKKKNAPSSS